MEYPTVFLIAVGLAADCFAVAISGSVAMSTISVLPVLRAAMAFGLFQGLMPVLGWLVGGTIVEFVAGYDHWVAFALLSIVGVRMIWESFRSGDENRKNTDITKGALLLILAVATSIDALAVGLTFAFIEVDILVASLTIGGVAFIATAIAFLLGRKAGNLIGKRAETVGGVVLIGIGLKIVLEHML